jgi:antitoxin component YwqK of YwqJK toxin-antitoxin module
MKIYLLIIITFVLASCSNTTKMKSKHENGAVMEEYSVLKSNKEIKSGLYKRYSTTNQLLEEANYANGKLDGTRTLYYPSGKKEIVENYKMDRFDGDYISYYESGNVSSKGRYENNFMREAWQYFYDLPNEPIKEIVHYQDNLVNGPFQEFYENGKKKAEGTYLETLDFGPVENGPFKGYYENGQLEMEGTFVNGRKNGWFKMYDEAGNLVEEKEYENGLVKK